MRRAVSIRRSLVVGLIAIILLLGLAIVTMMALRTRQAVRTLSEAIIQQAAQTTAVKLDGLFTPLTRQVEALRAWGRAGLLDLESPAELAAGLAPLLQRGGWSSALLVADDRGREYLLSLRGDTWTSRELRRDSWGNRVRWRQWRDDPAAAIERETVLDYDPRSRPWYLGAVEWMEQRELETVYWTEPYRFHGSGRPGLTASAAFRDRAGHLRVVAIDLELIEISRFTSSIQLLDEGAVFVLTEEGRLVGVPRLGTRSPAASDIEPLLLKRPEEIGTRAAQDASDRLVGDPASWGRPQRLVSDGEPWWGQVSPFQLSPDRRLLIGVAVPEQDILGQVLRQRVWVVALTLAVLAIGIWRALVLSRRFSQPIEELVAESERISTGDLDPGPPIRTRISEVQQLASAHDRMRRGLATLLRLERDLQLAREIQQSTWPKRLPELTGFDLAASTLPADETGGDSYDVIGLQRADGEGGLVFSQERADQALLLLADATGHGVGPALSVTQLRSMLRMAIRVRADLSDILTHLNEQLFADLPPNRFVTAWFGLLDTGASALTFFSAAQAPLLRYLAAEDRFEVLASNAVPLGLFPRMAVPRPREITMAPGDLYAVLSDGFFEAESFSGEEQGVERICRLLRHHRGDTATAIVEAVREATDVFTGGAPATDDRTIILIKRI